MINRMLLALAGGAGGFEAVGYLIGETGTSYTVIGGVIRNNGASDWVLYGGAHTPIHLSTVSADATKIRVTYDFTATAVCVGIVTPNQELIQDEILAGASVGLSYMDIYLAQGGVELDPRAVNLTDGAIWIFGIFIL